MVIHVKIANANWTDIKAIRPNISYQDLEVILIRKYLFIQGEKTNLPEKLPRIKNHTSTRFMTRAEFQGIRQRTVFFHIDTETGENVYKKYSKNN